MSLFWNLWIFILTAISFVLVLWVLLANRKVAVKDSEEPENKTTGHSYDGIEEYDNPLPRWWFNLFIGSVVYAIIYMVFFPGVWSGVLGWTQINKLEKDQQAALEQYKESYDVFSKMPVEELIHDNRAIKMGIRLFANNCAVCHGADGGGNFGIPNLTDNDWLYGGTPDAIRHSLEHGRKGFMPGWGQTLGEKKIAEVTEYVLQMSGQEHNATAAVAGKAIFEQNCHTCHGQDGKGLQAFGAPNLTDDIWLYDGSREGIVHSVRKGIQNEMPAQQELLREEKIHLLTAYVYSLSFNYE